MERAASDGAAGGQDEDQAWVRVADALLAVIGDGTLEPGAKVPSRRALREQHRCGWGPVIQALADLERRGAIRRVQGVGYQVTPVEEPAGDPREWVRAANAIVDLITSGEFPGGTLLPARHALIRRLGATGRTVRRATEELARQEVIEFTPARRYKVQMNFRYVPPVIPDTPGRDRPMQALAWAWEGVYQLSGVGSELEAWRLDGSGSVRGGTPAELRDAIIADYPKYAAGTP